MAPIGVQVARERPAPEWLASDDCVMARRRQRSGWEETRRSLYLTQRFIGDVSAAERGRLPQRLIRRRLTRSIFRSLRGLGR
jgi:hypothetical protein